MYNRYIREPDGSYRRNRMPEPPVPRPPVSVPQEEHSTVPAPCPPPPESPAWQPAPPRRPPPPKNNRKPQEPAGIGSFLKQLLPGNFDTEDLMIVLLLLLMSGDCREDQNTALLTLVLYLFL